MNESDVLEAALNVMDTTLEMYSLIAAIDAALAVKAPAGDPDTIAAQADTYHRVAHICQQVADDEHKVKTQSLPASWHGQAAQRATQALGSLQVQADTAVEAFAAGSKALASWSDQLRTAQSQDAQGRAQLVMARTVLSHLFMQDLLTVDPSVIPPATREAAISGCHDRWEAANLVSSAAAAASAALRQWPEQARAQQIRVPGIDALTAVTLAYNDGYRSVLSPTAEMLASKHLDAMSPADRAAFEKLVAGASSLTEAEYLWKAASAGYSLGQLKSFDAVIHPHGNNTKWLQQHLDPGIVTRTTIPDNGTLPPRTWISAAFSQPLNSPQCDSFSTVMARLAADPVLMLGVTTGQGPAAVGGAKAGVDSQAAVTARAQTLFNQYYAYGRAAEGDDAKKFLGITYRPAALPGIAADKGAIALDDRLLTPVTGSTYHYQPLNDTADRQAALPKIEAAVDAGKPVPISVRSPLGGHQMIIEDYQRGEFEIYNPWGYTQWVPTQQFVDAQLGDVTEAPGRNVPGGLPDPFGVALPQQ